MYSKKLQDKIIMAIGVIFFIPFFCFASDSVTDNFESYTSNLCGSHWVASSSSYLCSYSYIETYQSSKRVKFNYQGYAGTYGIRRDDLTYTNGIKSVSIKYMPNYNWNSTFWGNSPVRFSMINGAKVLSMYMRCYNGTTIDCRYNLNGTRGGCGTFLSSNCTANTTYTVTITKTDVYTYKMTVNGIDSQTITADFIPNSFSWYPMEYGNASYVNYYDDFSMEVEPTNGSCGSADGQTYPLDVPAADMCSSGYASGITINIIGDTVVYKWDCTGETGVKDYCEAYMGNNPVEPTCGASHEGFFNNAPSSGLCATGFYRNNSIMETMDAWIWTCGGLYSPTNIQCEAYKNIIDYPDIPELENCESYPLLEKIVCQIKNLFQSAFTPSADKIKELNKALYGIRNKAPFNYLYSVQNIGGQNIEEEQEIEFCILGNCGNIDVLEAISTPIKILASFLFSLAFIFWGINYIKRFFL